MEKDESKKEFNSNDPIILKAFKLNPLFRELMTMDATTDEVDMRQLSKELAEKYGAEYFVNFLGAVTKGFEEAKNSNTLKGEPKTKSSVDNINSLKTSEALKNWHNKINRYINDEIYLDDLERVVEGCSSDFKDQLILANNMLHADLLVNTLMVELGDTRQIHYYLCTEIKSFDKNIEIYSIFYVASGFEKFLIESNEGDSSSKVLNSLLLMKNWCLLASDEPKFKTIILDRLINRLLQVPAKEDSNFIQANKFANHIVYTGSEKLKVQTSQPTGTLKQDIKREEYEKLATEFTSKNTQHELLTDNLFPLMISSDRRNILINRLTRNIRVRLNNL